MPDQDVMARIVALENTVQVLMNALAGNGALSAAEVIEIETSIADRKRHHVDANIFAHTTVPEEIARRAQRGLTQIVAGQRRRAG